MAGSVRYSVRIRINGELGPALAGLFEDLAVTPSGDGTTVLEGQLTDQSAIHGLLARIRDLGLSLVTVESAAEPADARADLPDDGNNRGVRPKTDVRGPG